MRLLTRVVRHVAGRKRREDIVAAAALIADRRRSGEGEIAANLALPASSMLTVSHLRDAEDGAGGVPHNEKFSGSDSS